MKSLQDLFEQDARLMRDASLPAEAYRAVAAGAVELFHEATKRAAFPVTVTGLGPGAIKSRKIKIVDMGAYQHGMSGTNGTWDRASYETDDQVYYPVYHNIEVPFREQESSKLGGLGLDLFRDSGRTAGELIVEGENKLMVAGLGPVTGFVASSGIQTFASAGAWTTAGIFWQDVTKAIGKLENKKVPVTNLAMLLHPLDKANALQVFSNTDMAQIDKVRQMFPGGIHTSTDVTEGKAYVYQKSPTVFEVRVSQDVTVIPLPRTDEDERMRTRVITTTHTGRADGIVEVTSVNV